MIPNLIDQLLGTACFKKFDVRNGYNNIRIQEGDEWKGAFICNRGLFEPIVMYFGMSNSPATFQSYMNDIFEDPILKGWILVYMDDILVFAKTMEELNKRTKAVLDIMEEQGLHLKPEKCQLQKRQIEFLGSVISEKGVDTKSGKVQAIVKWLPPKDLKGLQQFLGFANYYRTFIEGYSHIVTPLANLTQKNVPST